MRKNLPIRVEHGGQIRWHHTRGRTELLDFSANINPYPPDIHWTPDLSMLKDYPDDRYETLKEEIGRVFGRDASEITVGNGSVELIRAFCTAILKKGDTVCITPPTFAEYEMAALLAGARCSTNSKGATVQFLCNPNNPTGKLHSKTDLISLLEETAKRGTYMFIDEAFIELSDPRQSLADVSAENLFLLRSLTKSFAVPGIRFGYGFGTPELIERVETVRLPWTVNAFAEAFAIEAFRNYDALRDSREAIARERGWLCECLSALGLVYDPPSANYILIEVPIEAELLVDKLLQHDILVRNCRSFGLPHHIRVAVRTHAENRQLIEALETCLP